jgi:hypothetical protein
MNDAIISLAVSIVSLLGTFAIVVRLFTKTESKLDVVEERGRETAALARATADIVNGESRTAHTALAARVAALESTTTTLATKESVAAVLTEVRMGIGEIKTILARIEKDIEHG